MTPENPPAFPVHQLESQYRNDGQYRDVWIQVGGLTMRDWFAGQALALGGEWFHNNGDKGTVSELAYQMADAMLKAREP